MTESGEKHVGYTIEAPDIVRTDVLETIAYQYKEQRGIDIVISQPEFTSVCPMTGLPDFGAIIVTYRGLQPQVIHPRYVDHQLLRLITHPDNLGRDCLRWRLRTGEQGEGETGYDV